MFEYTANQKSVVSPKVVLTAVIASMYAMSIAIGTSWVHLVR